MQGIIDDSREIPFRITLVIHLCTLQPDLDLLSVSRKKSSTSSGCLNLMYLVDKVSCSHATG